MNKHAAFPQSMRRQAAATAVGGAAAAAVLGLLALAGPAMASHDDASRWEFIMDGYHDNGQPIHATTVAARARPTFVDIDGDGDQDLFIGYSYRDLYTYINYNRIAFYRNDGVSGAPRWNLVTDTYNGIDTGPSSFPTPTFVDIDGDGDQDLFIGTISIIDSTGHGTITFYRNIGDPHSPQWQFVTSAYNGIDVGSRIAPTFVDIDKDGDQDLFIGAGRPMGANPPPPTIYFYRNTGSTVEARWDDPPETPYKDKVWLEGNLSPLPIFVDIDGDGDQDLFIGSSWAAD